MWSRSVLKRNAKDALRGYYWPAVLVCFIAALLSGSLINSGSQVQMQLKRDDAALSAGIGLPFQADISSEQFVSSLMLLAFVSLVVSLLITLLGIFVGNVIVVGKLNYFLESRYQGQSAGIGRLFCGFSGGYYVNVMKCMFFRDLFTFLWSLLFIIPGIYKHYEYYMVPYLLSEYPDMDRKEAFQRSKELMDGNKFDTWVLELSFLGWILLGAFTCGIGLLFLNPYYEATLMELYLNLKQNVYGTVQQADGTVIDSDYTME